MKKTGNQHQGHQPRPARTTTSPRLDSINRAVNPFTIPHVVDLIVNNLGRADLLNARLVNKDWNKACLKLTRTKYRMNLYIIDGTVPSRGATREAGGLGDLEAYVEFWSKIQATYVMPFHIRLNLEYRYRHYPDDELANTDSADEVVNVKYLATSEKSISFLADVFGVEAIQALEINFDGCTEGHWEEIVQLLKKCAPGLQLLDMFGLSFHTDMYSTEQVLRDANITFPKLLVLKCNTDSTPDYQRQMQGWPDSHPPIYGSILEQSPALRKLVFSESSSYEFSSIPFNTLEVLRMENGYIDDYDAKLVISCAQKNSITLKEFSLHHFGTKAYYDFDTTLTEMLENLAGSLENLTVDTHPSSPGSVKIEFIPLPTLPHLKKIQLLRNPNSFDFPLFLINSTETFCFRQELLSNLCTVQIDVGNFLATIIQQRKGHEKIIIQNQEIFPKVTTLILVDTNCDWIDWMNQSKSLALAFESTRGTESTTYEYPNVSIASNFNHFNTIFPNVCRVVLKMLPIEEEYYRRVNNPNKGSEEILLEVLFGSYFTQIRELQIEFSKFSCNAEPLVGAFNKKKQQLGVNNLSTWCKFKDLKVLKLVYFPKTIEKDWTTTYVEDGNRALKETLQLVAENFKSVWKLEIPRDWIGKAISTRKIRLGYIEKICSDHPHLTINLFERQDFWKDGDFDEE